MSNIRTYEITHCEQEPFPIQQKDSTDYLLGGALTLRNGVIDKYQFEEGYCQATPFYWEGKPFAETFTFCYYDQDHLGNVRQVTEADGSKQGVVIQRMNYYTFGAEFCDNSSKSYVQNHKYNGKEVDRMHGLDTYDYGVRQYDPTLYRWDRMDPHCEKYYNVSPYAYCHNNPVMMIDPDGKDDYTINLVSGCITITPTQTNTHSFYIENKEQTKFIGSYSYNDNYLIGMSGNISFENFDGQDCKITFKPGNDSEQYMSPLALGALIGSTAEVGASDVYVNHFSNSDGSSPKPSKSHKNGVNGDLRYFRSDSNGNPIIGPGNITDKSFDEKREIPFVNALHKYGWTNMISERYNGKLLPYSRSAKELGIPVAFVCFGEKYPDIDLFDSEKYMNELLGN